MALERRHTIIECLKYATTGDLPPNSKGGAFIHDPKLCGEKEVLAQVKLSFKGTSGAKMVATRSLQLTVKKTVRQQKTLEGQLLMVKDGERIAVSSRVAELDQIMPQYLGVSKAVLDNVIFCHQDESLWPMSEPSVLKKKFDEIFEALKYTKAIDNIKVLRKKQNEELTKFRIIEQHSKQDKDKGERAERRSTQLSDEIEKLRIRTQNLGDEIRAATREVDEARQQSSQFHAIVAQLQGKRIEESTKQESVESLKEQINEEMHESDDALQSMLDQHEERQLQYANEANVQRQRYTDLTNEMKKLTEELGRKQAEHGRYQAEQDQYERQVRHRETLVKETARRHNVRGFDLELNDNHVREFVERIIKMTRDQKTTVERVALETQRETGAAQKTLNELNERKRALNQSKENAWTQINLNDRKVATHQAGLNRISVDEGAKATLEAAIEDLQTQVHNAKADFGKANFQKRIEDAELQSRQLEEKTDQLNTELLQATEHAESTARIDFLRKCLIDSQRSLSTMEGAHGDRISRIVGPEWSVGTLENLFNRTITSKVEDIRDAEHQRNDTSRELEQIEFRIRTTQDEVNRKLEHAAACEQAVKTALGDDEAVEYPGVVRDLETSRDVLRGDLESFGKLKDYYNDCQQLFEKNDVCRLCERTFKHDKERSKYKAKIENLISQAAKQTIDSELKTTESDLKKMRQVAVSYEDWQRLSKTEIPDLESEHQRLEPLRAELVHRIEEQDRIVNERTTAKREVESMSQTIQNIAKYSNDIGNFESQLEELFAKQSQKGLARGLQEIREEQKVMNEQSRSVNKDLASISGERERAKGHITGIEMEMLDTKAKLSDVGRELHEKIGIASQIEDLMDHSVEQKESIRRMDEELHELAPQILQSQVKLDDIERRGGDRRRELEDEASRLSGSLGQLRLAEQEIHNYIDKRGTQQLARAKQELENLHDDQSRLEDRKIQITRALNKLQQQEQSHSAIERVIKDNLRYRRDSRALESVREEIMRLKSHNAEADKAKWDEIANKMQVERGRLSGEQASIMGQMKSKDDQLLQLLNDWNTDYRDAAQKYKEAHIKVEATKAAVEDLGRYGGALDQAIMKYHSLKMEEINRIIEELWKRTYQGTDVDTILIRSDNENTKGNKSYNYRVCMVKQDAEMDMRGRCSAGQKVLASIIIRLALAECFGVNCGLIALDEPTTNLDRENIQSLAASLHDIIKNRRGQSNFQLIVITHDEDFLRYLSAADFCDYYYRVARNERQKSIIERQSIADVL